MASQKPPTSATPTSSKVPQPSKIPSFQKALKKPEIYQGAKLFYLSGVLNRQYPDSEIMNFSRFIAGIKFRPLVFRNTYPYLLADRIEGLTNAS